MIKIFKFRLYPTKKQTQAIDGMIETHRRIYNNALAERKTAWEERKESITSFQQNKLYAIQKQVNEYYQKTNSASCQRTIRRLDKAFNAFFRRIKTGDKPGYPRFKGRNRFNSVEFTYGNGIKIRANGNLYIQHIGEIRLKQHRSIIGTIKSAIIKHKSGRYYVCFCAEYEPRSLEPADKSVGLDMGISKLVTTSDGEFFEPPKYLRQSEKKLRTQQRKVARRKKGSNRRHKIVKLLQRTHEHIANQRRDTAHKIARKLVNQYDLIAVEDLQITNMLKNHHLAKSISDAAWNIFINILTNKAEEAGRRVIKVDPKYTSQDCSQCNKRVKKDLSIRIHDCPYCGLVLDRDINAAKNILARTGLSGANVEVVNSSVS